MLLLSEQDVERLIDPHAAIEAALDGYRQNTAGILPPGRLDLQRNDPKGAVLVLAGHSEDGIFAAKTNAHSYPDATSRRRLAASLMALWDMRTCSPLALIATTGFNNHRTASGFAAAAQLLAPPDAQTLVVFGAGKIAPAAIRYLAKVRPLAQVVIGGRGPERAAALAAAIRQWPDFSGIAVETVRDVAAATAQADIIVTVTTSDTPVFPGSKVKPGALVILGGANRPAAREADDDLIARARVYVDHLDGCLERAGDIRIPLATGTLVRSRIVGEIGAVTAGQALRTGPDDVTVFKSMGVVAQDLALARILVDRARTEHVGVEFDMVAGGITRPGGAEANTRTDAPRAFTVQAAQ